MLRKVESTSDVNRGPEPCQSGTALTFPVLCLACTRVVSQIDGAVRVYTHVHDDHYLTRSKINSLLTEMITPQTYIQVYIYIYIHIKPLPVPRVFGARSGSPRIMMDLYNWQKKSYTVHTCTQHCSRALVLYVLYIHVNIFHTVICENFIVKFSFCGKNSLPYNAYLKLTKILLHEYF